MKKSMQHIFEAQIWDDFKPNLKR